MSIISVVAATGGSITSTAFCVNSTTTSATCSTGFEVSQTHSSGSCFAIRSNLCNSSSTIVSYMYITSVNHTTFNYSLYQSSSCAGAPWTSRQNTCAGDCLYGTVTTCSVSQDLQSNIPVSDSVAGESYNYYTYVPSTPSFSLSFKQDVSNNLSFVYIAQGYQPSIQRYEWAMTSTDDYEQSIQLTGSGTFYITVYGFSLGENEYTIEASNGTWLAEGQIYNGTLNDEATQNFIVEVGENVYIASFVVKTSRGYPIITLQVNENVTQSAYGQYKSACLTLRTPEAGTYIYSVSSEGYAFDYTTAFYENSRTPCLISSNDESIDIVEAATEIKATKNSKTIHLN